MLALQLTAAVRPPSFATGQDLSCQYSLWLGTAGPTVSHLKRYSYGLLSLAAPQNWLWRDQQEWGSGNVKPMPLADSDSARVGSIQERAHHRLELTRKDGDSKVGY